MNGVRLRVLERDGQIDEDLQPEHRCSALLRNFLMENAVSGHGPMQRTRPDPVASAE